MKTSENLTSAEDGRALAPLSRSSMNVLECLVGLGNTVVVIEHNLDVIKMADYVIDLGPEGGNKGGALVAHGSPEEIVTVKASYTGRFLKDKLYSTPTRSRKLA